MFNTNPNFWWKAFVMSGVMFLTTSWLQSLDANDSSKKLKGPKK